MQASTSRQTVPAPPLHADPIVARFLAAQAAVHVALESQRVAIDALRMLDSTHPAAGAL